MLGIVIILNWLMGLLTTIFIILAIVANVWNYFEPFNEIDYRPTPTPAPTMTAEQEAARYLLEWQMFCYDNPFHSRCQR